jgi:acyl carrier protein
VPEATFEPTLKAVISEVLEVPIEDIGPGFNGPDHPTWSSLNHLMLVSQVERHFGVTFSNHELPELTSYERLREALARRLKAP